MTNTYIDPLVADVLGLLDKECPGDWTTHNPWVQDVLARLPELQNTADTLPAGMIESIADADVEVVNRFLQERGFPMRLQPGGLDDVAIAGVLKILCPWLRPGRPTPVAFDGQEVPGVSLKDFYVYGVSGAKVLELCVSNDLQVFLAESPDLASGMELALRALNGPASVEPGYTDAVIPKVNAIRPFDVSGLVGTTKGRARITQAVGQAKLQLDEFGALGEAAVAISATRGCSIREYRPFVITKPFVCAFCNDSGVALAFHVTAKDLAV